MLTTQYLAALGPQKPPLALVPVLDLDSLPSITWLIEGMMPSQGLLVLYGEAGHAKSFFALDFALSIAAGQDWRGRKVTQGSVVYIAGEGSRGMKDRVKAWRLANPNAVLTQAYMVLEPVMLHEPKEVDRLMAELAKLPTKPALIVVDTLAQNAVGVEENSVKEMGMWLYGARRLQERFGASVLILHHAAKGSERERGSTALRGAADTMMRVKKDPLGEVELSCTKQKDGPEFPSDTFVLTPLGNSAVLTSSSPTSKGNFQTRLLELASTLGPTDAATKLVEEFPEVFADSTNPVEAAKGRVKRARVQLRAQGAPLH